MFDNKDTKYIKFDMKLKFFANFFYINLYIVEQQNKIIKVFDFLTMTSQFLNLFLYFSYSMSNI